MPWYRVTKTIKGRKYDYWQRTYRVGKTVKTLNKYIGPTQVTFTITGYRDMTGAARHNARMDKTWTSAMYWKNAYDVLRAHEAKISDAGQLPVPPQFCSLCGATDHDASAHDLKPAVATGEKFDRDTVISQINELNRKISDAIIGIDTGQIVGVEETDRAYAFVELKRAERDNLERELGKKSDWVQGNMNLTKRVSFADPRSQQTPDSPADTSAMEKLDPFYGLDAKSRKPVLRAHALKRAEDERTQYGPLKARIARQKAELRAAKRKTKGLKALNRFLALALSQANKK